MDSEVLPKGVILGANAISDGVVKITALYANDDPLCKIGDELVGSMPLWVSWLVRVRCVGSAKQYLASGSQAYLPLKDELGIGGSGEQPWRRCVSAPDVPALLRGLNLMDSVNRWPQKGQLVKVLYEELEGRLVKALAGCASAGVSARGA
jgi:hypothetical protein